jgi:tyrosinase
MLIISRGDLSSAERKAYIAAVQCLMTSPSKLPAGQFPGAHNRYEDFVVTHMQQTLNIHGTVSLSALAFMKKLLVMLRLVD